MACCLLIFLYIHNELSYDRNNKNADHIYRVVTEQKFPNRTVASAQTPRSLGQLLTRDCPEVLHVTRLSREHAGRVLVRRGAAKFYENGVVFADPSVFKVFTFPLVKGDPQTALQAPFTIVITQRMAQKYFGAVDPIGQTLTLRLLGDGDRFDYTITAIAQNPPSNSHITFDFLAAYQGHPFATTNGKEREDFNGLDVYTYLTLNPNTDPAALETKFARLERLDTNQNISSNQSLTPINRYTLQPLTTIHLHSHLSDELRPNGDITYVSLFAAIAFFILILACINFANLATAQSATRAREIGVRKMFGSYRSHLIYQFLSESTLLSFISLVLAVGLVELLLPAFNQLTGKSFDFSYLTPWHILPILMGLALFVGLLSGAYPAFFLSAFRPAMALKGSASRAGQSLLRSGLVLFQFVVSMALMVGTVIIMGQMHYISSKKLGFEAEQVIVVEGTEVLKRHPEPFRQAVMKLPGVVEAAYAENMPGRPFERATVRIEGTSEEALVAWMFTNFDYAETMGLKLVEGRTLSRNIPADATGVLLNKQAVAALGMTNPIGRRILWRNTRTYTVVGVVENFNFASLHQEIGPLMLIGPDPQFENRPCQLLAVRLNARNLPATLAALSATWRTFVPQQPFAYTFLNADLDALYRAEQTTGALFGTFAALAIFIACLGLFGLAAFTAERRTKEIGIRKTLGATILNIVVLLSRDFLKLIVLAFVVVVPPAYLGMRRWLDTFAYRTDLTWEPFALVGLLTLGIALATVSYQSIKAALADPIDALRDE